MIDNTNNTEATVNRVFENPSSRESKAFFAGARALMSALREIPSDQYGPLLAFENQQHIMAVLACGAQRRDERKRQEALTLVKYCRIDKAKLRGFIFDAPAIDNEGRAVDANGELLEDDNYNPLPGKTNPGWSECTVYRLDSEEEISLEEYNSLSSEEKEDYGRYKTLTVKSTLNKPMFHIHDFDRELVEALIHHDILIGDPVIKRYQKVVFDYSESEEFDDLWPYRSVILKALSELSLQHCSAADVIVAGAKKTELVSRATTNRP